MEISILLWNVWNLPSWLTDNKSKTRAKKISPLLNAYDIVVLNEAFVNIKHLLSRTTHPYIYRPPRPWQTLFSPGMIFLSRFEIVDSSFEIYHRRSGVDRFAAKGIAQITVRLVADGQEQGRLRIFGTHMQASHSESAQKARHNQARQAAQFVQRFAAQNDQPDAGTRTILAGDLNMGPHLGSTERYSQHYHDEGDHIARTAAYANLLTLSGLRDVASFSNPERDEREYQREICRVLLNPEAFEDKMDLSYTLQEHTDGHKQLSDTKALCLQWKSRECHVQQRRLRNSAMLLRDTRE